ncbi:MAG: metal ABC transporter permease [Gammaproteobacteria bacterium]|nr:metal ABC transporter permease [Gammaproteobacteria bacterium]MCP4982477.1 metal ABC transporter permease [Gammaproteobacteria bacterium]
MTEWLDDFLVRSVIAGLIMVAIAAPMGCLMVWQRLAFLSDTLGHAAVLGVALGLLLEVKPLFGVLAVALLIVFSLSRVSSFNSALSETTLAIISHTGLAGGIILVGLLPAHTVSLEAILFGDLLATTRTDLIGLLLTTILLLFLLMHHWRSFVAVSVSREIAQAEGIKVRKVQFLMYIMIALLVAVMMKVMGVLLIAAILVIPTSSARLFSRSPEQMVLISGLYGLGALAGGVTSSFHFDWQTGPAIVVCATVLLLLTLAITHLKKPDLD